jgi:hypothetical protein
MSAEDQMTPTIIEVYRDIKRLATNPEGHVYLLHTPLGVLQINKFTERDITGYTLLSCTDDQEQLRLIAFSNEQIATFPIEIKNKAGGSKNLIGFNIDAFKEEVD